MSTNHTTTGCPSLSAAAADFLEQRLDCLKPDLSLSFTPAEYSDFEAIYRILQLEELASSMGGDLELVDGENVSYARITIPEVVTFTLSYTPEQMQCVALWGLVEEVEAEDMPGESAIERCKTWVWTYEQLSGILNTIHSQF